jgi:hypothetical protein
MSMINLLWDLSKKKPQPPLLNPLPVHSPALLYKLPTSLRNLLSPLLTQIAFQRPKRQQVHANLHRNAQRKRLANVTVAAAKPLGDPQASGSAVGAREPVALGEHLADVEGGDTEVSELPVDDEDAEGGAGIYWFVVDQDAGTSFSNVHNCLETNPEKDSM